MIFLSDRLEGNGSSDVRTSRLLLLQCHLDKVDLVLPGLLLIHVDMVYLGCVSNFSMLPSLAIYKDEAAFHFSYYFNSDSIFNVSCLKYLFALTLHALSALQLLNIPSRQSTVGLLLKLICLVHVCFCLGRCVTKHLFTYALQRLHRFVGSVCGQNDGTHLSH